VGIAFALRRHLLGSVHPAHPGHRPAVPRVTGLAVSMPVAALATTPLGLRAGARHPPPMVLRLPGPALFCRSSVHARAASPAASTRALRYADERGAGRGRAVGAVLLHQIPGWGQAVASRSSRLPPSAPRGPDELRSSSAEAAAPCPAESRRCPLAKGTTSHLRSGLSRTPGHGRPDVHHSGAGALASPGARGQRALPGGRPCYTRRRCQPSHSSSRASRVAWARWPRAATEEPCEVVGVARPGTPAAGDVGTLSGVGVAPAARDDFRCAHGVLPEWPWITTPDSAADFADSAHARASPSRDRHDRLHRRAARAPDLWRPASLVISPNMSRVHVMLEAARSSAASWDGLGRGGARAVPLTEEGRPEWHRASPGRGRPPRPADRTPGSRASSARVSSASGLRGDRRMPGAETCR
jgi:hypothetical protein